MQGFLNLNKPTGFTSHDCVAKIRRILRLKRVGHGGTLDPAATGVLPIALGKATRLLQYTQQDKSYHATIRLGMTTTTDDLEGEVVGTQSVSGLTLEAILPVLEQFQGKIQQVPPIYSAIQVQGKRLYDLARAGKEVEVPVREVEVYRIEVLDWRSGEFPELDIAIACGAGTYIRAIARDLGIALNTGGVLASLTRTQSCGFNLAESLTLEEVEAQVQAGIFNPILSVAALTHLASVSLSAENARRWCQGQRIVYHETKEAIAPLLTSPLRVHHENGCLLGIGKFINTENEVIVLPHIVLEGG
ncbi:MAG TPA: tRNA pseudouridine(55) synthase TruB [Cyanobacteria bacterium UBA11162]|nr:tRNA pseudouridine(55) synthase TruB [Cyanobacteria bacterium UBA11162]